MKSILWTVAIVFAGWYIGRMYNLWISALFFAVVILVTLYKRRALIFTRIAANAYYANGDAEKGAKFYEKAYKTGEMTPDCKISYSSFCLRENNFKKGKRLLNEVINSRYSSMSDKLGAKHNLAVMMWREGDLDGAIALLETVHKQAAATNTYGTLGVLYLERAKKGNPEEELAFMLEAYEYNSDDKTIADNLGELYYIMGEYEKAEEVYQALMKLAFFTPMPYFNYGRVLKVLGKSEEAKEMLEKALECRFTSVMTVSREDVKREIESL